MADRKTARDRLWDAVLAIITGISVAVGGAFLIYVGTPIVETQLRPPTCDDPRGLEPLSVDPPTSDSPNAVLDGYGLDHLVDTDIASAWVEGVVDETPSTNLGQGISLKFTLPEGGADVQMICIVNGYAKSWTLFQRNASVRLLTVTTDAGTTLTSGLDAKHQSDFASFEELEFTHGQTRSVEFRIDSARQGSFDAAAVFSDLAVSEVEFWVNR